MTKMVEVHYDGRIWIMTEEEAKAFCDKVLDLWDKTPRRSAILEDK